MRVAVVHDWLVTYAGSERVLEQILCLFPDAHLYSLLDFLPADQRAFLGGRPVHTSFLQRMPFARTMHRNYLPLMPRAIESFDLSGYDLVISSSHAVAKGVRTGPGQLHICYCHTPMRYAWDLRRQYLDESGFRGVKRLMAEKVLDYVRNWDLSTVDRVDHFVANSAYIAERIRRTYGRDAAVIYPPVDVKGFGLRRQKEDFYLAVSRMVPYKRMDLIVEAFTRLPDRRLIVIGDGPEFEKVEARASGNVELLGYQSPETLRSHLQCARALIFAAEEDFGITPVEAQACGTPVIAYGRGGVLESVKEGTTGVFFYEQSPDAVAAAVRAFELQETAFDPLFIRENAERFGQERFRREVREFVERCLAAHRGILVSSPSEAVQ